MDIHREAYLCCIACLQRFNVSALLLISTGVICCTSFFFSFQRYVVCVHAHLSPMSMTMTDHPRQWLKKNKHLHLVFGHVSPIPDCLRSIRPKYNSLVKSLAALMAVNVVTIGTGSTMLVPALRFPALPDAAAPQSASQQNASVPLPAPGNDYDVSMDLTAELTGIIDVSEEGARLRAQAWRFEQTFEERAEQLVEYERNMAERTWQEVGANRAEVTSALEAVAANNAQLVAQGNIAFEQRDRALRQTVREEFDGYRAHLAMEMHEDIPAHVEARIADVCDFFRGNSTRVPSGWNGMPVSTVKCLQWHCVRSAPRVDLR